MKSRMILLMMICAFFAAGCGLVGPTDPDKPDPKPPFVEKRFTLKVEYERRDVKRPDWLWRSVRVTIYDPNLKKCLVADYLTKKDDYNHEMTCLDMLETESYNSCYYIYAQDDTRWDGTDNSTTIVGDIFTLTTFNEDGTIKSTLKLTNIMQNDLPTNPCKGLNARMAKFCIKRDGTLTNGN